MVEPLRHRQTKGAGNGYAQPKATAPHSYSTHNSRTSRRCCKTAAQLRPRPSNRMRARRPRRSTLLSIREPLLQLGRALHRKDWLSVRSRRRRRRIGRGERAEAEAPQQKPEHHPDATEALGPNIIGARAKSLAPQIGSKLATVIDLLQRSDGATISNLIEATGCGACQGRAGAVYDEPIRGQGDVGSEGGCGKGCEVAEDASDLNRAARSVIVAERRCAAGG